MLQKVRFSGLLLPVFHAVRIELRGAWCSRSKINMDNYSFNTLTWYILI